MFWLRKNVLNVVDVQDNRNKACRRTVRQETLLKNPAIKRKLELKTPQKRRKNKYSRLQKEIPPTIFTNNEKIIVL